MVITKHTSGAGGGRATLLGVAALLAVAAGIAGAAWATAPGRPGWWEAIAFAVAVALPGSLLAWIIARLPTAAPAIAVAWPLAGVSVRIIPPLVAIAWLSAAQTWLRDAGAAPLLVIFYLGLLATDILLHIILRCPLPGETHVPH
ncbi:MAG: hypothetical protein WCQ77_04075 [Planctomycetota bacterium]